VTDAIYFIILAIAVLACLPWLLAAAVFCIESGAAFLFGPDVRQLLRHRSESTRHPPRPSIAVLIPAHNEELVIASTIEHVRSRLAKGGCGADRVRVGADNCDDSTAKQARAAGAEVVERTDAVQRGKGFALNCGFEHLRHDPPNVVFVLDSDCRVGRFTFEDAPRLADETGRPVQSLNLCRSSGRSATEAVSELGIRFKNLIRPSGLKAMHLPCHLMGTGMALPWSVVQRMPKLGADLAEDMKLGVDLALVGKPTLFCPTSRVVSGLPGDDSAFESQRTRWEQGHLKTAMLAPSLIWHGVTTARTSLVALGLDLLIPPLSLFVACGMALLVATAVIALVTDVAIPFVAMAIAVASFAATIGLGWAIYCRRVVPLKSLASIPWFIVRKLPIYFRFLLGRGQTAWVRTARATASHPASAGSDLSTKATT